MQTVGFSCLLTLVLASPVLAQSAGQETAGGAAAELARHYLILPSFDGRGNETSRVRVRFDAEGFDLSSLDPEVAGVKKIRIGKDYQVTYRQDPATGVTFIGPDTKPLGDTDLLSVVERFHRDVPCPQCDGDGPTGPSDPGGPGPKPACNPLRETCGGQAGTSAGPCGTLSELLDEGNRPCRYYLGELLSAGVVEVVLTPPGPEGN